MASMCVHDGPAQKVVMSSTRSPSNGSESLRDWPIRADSGVRDSCVHFGGTARCVRRGVGAAAVRAKPRRLSMR